MDLARLDYHFIGRRESDDTIALVSEGVDSHMPICQEAASHSMLKRGGLGMLKHKGLGVFTRFGALLVSLFGSTLIQGSENKYIVASSVD